MMKNIKMALFLGALGLFAASQIEAAENYSDAYAFFGRRSSNRCISTQHTYHPINQCETGTPELTDDELVLQLGPDTRQIFRNMSPEGKQLALDLASDHYRYNKNAAVRAAAEMMQDKYQSWFGGETGVAQPQGEEQTYQQAQPRTQYNTGHTHQR